MIDKQQRKVYLEEKFHQLYGVAPHIWVQAPGRVDLMGSHTDYNLGYVLIQAINRNTWIAARPRTDNIVRIASTNVADQAEFDLMNIQQAQQAPWSNYVRGVADVFQKEKFNLTGFDGLIHSTIPFGSGLSSSAALEVATATLFETLGGWQIDPLQKALLCQRAENEFVGMNCGIMDQYASVMGRAGNVLLLDCRSLESVIKPIRADVQMMICDTRAERQLIGTAYAQRRWECETGVRVLSKYYPGIESLRDISLPQLNAHQKDLAPVVYRRCRFVLEENQRVLDTADALAAGDSVTVGKRCVDSFEGARDLYEIVTPEMQAMFDAIMSAPGALGARGAGAGFGGCLVAFIRPGSEDAFTAHVLQSYTKQTGIAAEVFPVESADGAGMLIFD